MANGPLIWQQDASPMTSKVNVKSAKDQKRIAHLMLFATQKIGGTIDEIIKRQMKVNR